MGEGENKVMVGAVEQPGALPFQPAFDLDLIALGAGAVPAGVVPYPLDMAFGAGLDVSAQCGCTAAAELLGGFMIMQRELATGGERGKALTENLLHGVGHSLSLIYTPNHPLSSPCEAGLVQR